MAIRDLGTVRKDGSIRLEDLNRDHRRIRHSAEQKHKLAQAGFQHVLSSNVSAVSRTGTTSKDSLLIRFHNGSVYEYPGKAQRYEDLLNSNSKGKWVWSYLRGRNGSGRGSEHAADYKRVGKVNIKANLNITDKQMEKRIDDTVTKKLTRGLPSAYFKDLLDVSQVINGVAMKEVIIGGISVFTLI